MQHQAPGTQQSSPVHQKEPMGAAILANNQVIHLKRRPKISHTAGVTSVEGSPRTRAAPMTKVRKNDKTLQKILRSNLSPNSNFAANEEIDGVLQGSNYMTAGPVQVGKLMMSHNSGMNLAVGSQGRIISAANSSRGNSKKQRRTPAQVSENMNDAGQFAPPAIIGSFKSSTMQASRESS